MRCAQACRALQSRSYFCCKPHCYVNDAFLTCTADARSEFGSDPQMLTIGPMLSTCIVSPLYIPTYLTYLTRASLWANYPVHIWWVASGAFLSL